MIRLDGLREEGGGQILRSSLALSCHTGKPFTIEQIRGKRSPPGLKAQHLAGVQVARRLTGARVEGALIGSTRLVFEPAHPARGSHFEDVGTAGSLTLLLQSVLLPALTSGQPVELELVGGTDVSWSPPLDYLAEVLLPYYARLGEVELRVGRRGFHPKGKGRLALRLAGHHPALPPLDLTRPLERPRLYGRSVASEGLRERRVAERQAEAAREILPGLELECAYVPTLSTGSVVTLWAEEEGGSWPVRAGADLLGSRGVPAEEVGRQAARRLKRRLEVVQPVEEHLADNLVPFLALFGGKLLCQEVSAHTRGNAYVMEQFLPVRFQMGEHEVVCERS